MTIIPTAKQVENWALEIARIKKTIDVDRRNGGQCWDLPAYITIKYWGYWPPGNAIAWGYNRLPKGFKRFKNTSSFLPQPGDFAVWGTGSFNNGVGHVAIVVGKSTSTHFTSVDQNWYTANWTGSPPSIIKHSYYGISCFVRPPYRNEQKPQGASNSPISATKPKTQEPLRENTPNPSNEDTKPKYRTVKKIKYTTYNTEDHKLSKIYHTVVKGKKREGNIKGLTIKNANYMRSVLQLYNDRNKYIDSKEYPHFYIDRHHIWSPRSVEYEKSDDPNNIVVEVCGDLSDVKNDFLINEVVAIVYGVDLMNKHNISFKESNIKIDDSIWRSLKQHVGFDLVKDGKPSQKEIQQLIKAVVQLYLEKDKILFNKPKDIETTKKIKVSNNNVVSTIDKTSSNNSQASKRNITTKSVTQPQIVINKNPVTFTQALNLQMSKGQPKIYANGWVYANREQTSKAMEPNSIINNTTQRYQLLDLGKYQGISVTKLNEILNGKGTLHGKGQAFADGCKRYRINEIYLIAHALLESGHGNSNFASGKYGVYNYFGIGAFDNNPNNAVTFARNQGWTTPEKAIVGGAKFVRQSFIDKGQNTLYRMRWNPKAPATHQYATDIRWASHQATTIKKYYDQIKKSGEFFVYDYYK
ncbi:glucosaminidase domain-containing protein (plasmid) [Staphylococcus aureus]|uniref:glucosaminidase domain-containing protein n=1 Tax=Staphylococcus aureus TaxID=1280 RepID=UPI0021D0B8C5|nr:glucosaminidase domain-containing protein [Staphylococcus aureus]UXV54423.1 glucosaminidase domain-containing protein [Staphylococcus aureus]UXV57096.1 glucosaminidase domain-containing protein [Staphylococcus aureus]